MWSPQNWHHSLDKTFNLALAHSLHLSSSPSWTSLFSFFVLCHPVSVTHHSSCHALICDHSHISLLPLSHCLYILVYLPSHILSILASFSCSFIHTLSCQYASFLKKSLFSLFRLSVLYMFVFLLSHVASFLTPFLFFLCLAVFSDVFFFASFSLLLYSSLLLNIWLRVHRHDTTVPCWSWGCLDIKVEDKEGNMGTFKHTSEPFLCHITL